jgi:hypothetical protein
MSDWLTLLQKPTDSQEDAIWEGWFVRIAERILNGSSLVVSDERYRIVEIEFYYNALEHPDPFTHRETLQLQCGRWYFHRTRGVYRSGSFKGLDLSFGDGQAFGGVLIRGVETPSGELIDGPSLWVDHVLARTKRRDVAALDQAIGGRLAWDPTCILHFELVDPPRQSRIFQSPRVGLSLKRGKTSSEPPRFVMRPYRFLTEPRRISKGKAHMVLRLHFEGKDTDTIHQLTGCPRSTVERYITDFEFGRQQADFAPFLGIDLKPADLCRLSGVWHARWGKADR